MKRYTVVLASIVVAVYAHVALGGDLYRVAVGSHGDVAKLNAAEIDPVMRVMSGYLILADADVAYALDQDGVPIQLVASGVSKDELAVYAWDGRSDINEYTVAYREGNLKVLRVDSGTLRDSAQQLGLIPVERWSVQFTYREPRSFNRNSIRRGVDLDSLISLVKTDSLVSYTHRLEAFYRRVTGTDSNYACADWLESKLGEFGYDSVYLDTFTQQIYGEPTLCKNVVATKLGSNFPGVQIVIGAHRDAVPDCPGADDNGSGTASTMEIARVLRNVPTDVSFVFVLFDAEEQGVFGSAAYAQHAAARGDTIFYMLNSDMVADIRNTDQAAVKWVADSTYARLWVDLADSLVGINGELFYGSGADNMPFAQIGSYSSTVHEWEISDHYHMPSDSCVYLNYDYITALTRASLATVYAVGQDATCPGIVFGYPYGIPEFAAPAESASVTLTISCTRDGEIVSGSELVHYSINSEEYIQAPLVKVSGSEYTVALPPIACGDSIRFYFSAAEVETGVYYDSDASQPHVLIPASQFLSLFEDDFETAKPWTVYGTASRGQWERCLPASWTFPYTPYRDFDGSSHCYVTDNDAWSGDVDSGYTVLISPTFDASIGDARVRYARWFYNRWADLQPQDSMTVFISSNAGINWKRVETVGPDDEAGGGWIVKEFWTSEFIPPSEMTRLKFVASDLGENTPVEAALDAVSVTWYECTYEEPPYCGDSDGNEAIDIDDIVFLVTYIFTGGPPPDPPDRGDADCSGGIDIDDVVYLIMYVFLGGHAPCDIDGNGEPDC
jgi:aminopeptidase YwaD